MNIEKAVIVDRWFIPVLGASGEGDKTMEDFMHRVRDAGVPGITAKLEVLTTGLSGVVRGFLKGAKAKKQEAVEISNENLPGYLVYSGARDYGKLLIVSWYVVADKDKIPRLGRAATGAVGIIGRMGRAAVEASKGEMGQAAAAAFAGGDGEALLGLNVFETEELSAFASITHGALKEALEEMMKNKNLDFSKVDTHTRGFCNLS